MSAAPDRATILRDTDAISSALIRKLELLARMDGRVGWLNAAGSVKLIRAAARLQLRRHRERQQRIREARL